MGKFDFNILDRYRKEAEDLFNRDYNSTPTWKAAILESIFRPSMKVGGGRAPMTHLHPEHDKLNLPHGVYMPDWRKYRVEDHKALVDFQKKCHAAGLHDPWLRNYAFKFYPNTRPVRSQTAIVVNQIGFGLVAAILFFIAQKTYLHFNPPVYEHTPEYIEKHETGELH